MDAPHNITTGSADQSSSHSANASIFDLMDQARRRTSETSATSGEQSSTRSDILRAELRLRNELQMLSQADATPVPEIQLPAINPRRVFLFRIAPWIGAAVLLVGVFLNLPEFIRQLHILETTGTGLLQHARSLTGNIPLIALAVAILIVVSSLQTSEEK